MTREALLSPRYIVVFFNGRHYPSSSFVEGDIVVQKKMVKGLSLEGQLFWLYTNSSGKLVHTQIDISLYPHLFRALNWWEYRKVEDMPKYVKPIVASQYVYEFVSKQLSPSYTIKQTITNITFIGRLANIRLTAFRNPAGVKYQWLS